MRDVLIRAFGGKPVVATAVETGEKLTYVVGRSSVSRLQKGLTEPVGIPNEDVFRFDSEAYREIQNRWERGDKDAWSLAAR